MITNDILYQVPFLINAYGPGGRYNFRAKIVGLSDSISSFLVPINFMHWANKKIAMNDTEPPRRLILAVSDVSDPAISKFINKNEYETNNDIMGLSKVKGLIQTLFIFIGSLGGAFILLSMAIFLLNFQLIISRAMDDIKLLLYLGYKKGDLARNLIIVLLTLLGSSCALGLIFYFIISS